jgi:hypothetical protein
MAPIVAWKNSVKRKTAGKHAGVPSIVASGKSEARLPKARRVEMDTTRELWPLFFVHVAVPKPMRGVVVFL